MGGSTGGGIVRNNAQVTLTDPQVHGSLPANITQVLDPVLAKGHSNWDHHDCIIVSHALSWALCNL